MDNSFFDMLGILMAFIMVILLLSLVVTSLVQITQAGFGVRGKNLHFAVSQLLKIQRTDERDDPKENANKILNSVPAALLTRQAHKNPLFRIWGSGVSWIEPQELDDALDRRKSDLKLSPNQVQDIKDGFKQMEQPMKKRLHRNMRYLTVIWSIAVAGYFQVSSPALIAELSGNPQLRAEVLVTAESNIEKVQEAIVRLKSYENVAAHALEELETSHAEFEEIIEEASGIGSSREEIVAELNLVFADNDAREEIVKAYEARLNELVGESRKVAVDQATMAMQNLSLIGIQPWSDNTFYWKDGAPQVANVVGVAITALLLSFGAPFWFKRLQEVAGLRDSLKKLSAEPTTDSSSTDSNKNASKDSDPS